MIFARNIKYGFKREIILRKSIIYSVCLLYFAMIFLNLYGLTMINYRVFRELVSNHAIMVITWFLIFIYIIVSFVYYARSKTNI